MPKRNNVYAIMAVLMLSCCGTRNDSTKTPGSIQTQPVAEPASTTATVNPPSVMLVGTYEQVDNRAIKVSIDPNLLVSTNIVIPITPAGGGRLTPMLPQRLKADPTNQFYTTDGTFNRPGGEVDNMVFRVDSYAEGTLLDVTLIVQVRPSDSLSSPPFVDAAANGVLKLCGHPTPTPIPTPIPTPTPTPTPTPCKCCCDCNCGGSGGGGSGQSKQMLFLYHFVRV